MKWNPLLTKRGRIIAVAAVLFLLPTGYLASYPIAYRFLEGSDEASLRWYSMLDIHISIHYDPSREEMDRQEMWWGLQRYYYPPVEWVIDYTPLRHPIVALAVLMQTDKQILDDSRIRTGDPKRWRMEEPVNPNAFPKHLQHWAAEFNRDLMARKSSVAETIQERF